MKKKSKVILGIVGGFVGIGMISSAINGNTDLDATLLSLNWLETEQSVSITETLEETAQLITTTIEPTTITVTSDSTTITTTTPPTTATIEATTSVTTTVATTKATTSATTAKATIATTKPTIADSSIGLKSMTTPISPGEMATVSVKGMPNTEYNINVYYSSGASSAQGLENKTSDANGNVTWTWKIGINTNLGNYHLDIIGGGKTLQVNFTVK